MPIINTEIAETIDIKQNGQIDVSRYALANVQVGGVTRYVNQNGTLVLNNTTLIGGEFGDATNIGENALYYAFYRDTSLKGIVDLSNIITISGETACNNAFYLCTGISGADLRSLTSVNGKQACNYMFYGCAGITNVNLSSLQSITGEQACQYVFNNCTGLTNVNLGSLTTINGKSACYGMFSGCTNLINVDLSGLTSISGQNACQYMFRNCSSLKALSFPSLTTVTEDVFTNMLSGCSNVTVVFPVALENTIKSFTSYNNGFGGTNTNIIFGDVKILPVTISSGWTVLDGTAPLVNGENWVAVIGTHELFVYNADHFGCITFEVTNATTEFVFDPSQTQFNRIEISSNVSDVTYNIYDISIVGTGTNRWDGKDIILPNNEIYMYGTVSGNIYGLKEGYLSALSNFENSVTQSLYVTMQQATTITYTASDLLSNLAITSGYEDKYSVNNGQLVIHTDNTAADKFSGGLTLPSGASVIKISGSALVSSEANYDFGYIYFDTTQQTFTYSQIKNDNSDKVLFKQSGENNTTTSFETQLYTDPLVTDPYVLTIGWAQDKTIKGDNTMWVDPITIEYI